MTIIQANKFYFPRGGAEKYMLQLSKWLKTHGHHVVPFAMQHPKNLPNFYEAFFPHYIETEQPKVGLQGAMAIGRMLYSFESRKKIARLIDEVHPDICHIHNIYNQISPTILPELKKKGVPIVMTVHDHHLVSPQYNIWADGHGQDVRGLGMFRATATRFNRGSLLASSVQAASFSLHRLLRMYRDNVSIFLCPSEYIRRQLIYAGFSAEKLRVNNYGFDTTSVVPRYDNDGYILFVGRLSEEKGVDLVVRLARLLPEIKFKVAGTGPEEQSLRNTARGLNNIEFLGFKSGEDLVDLYKGALALLIPSRVHEIFPLVLLEAMAVGTPIIASHVGGIPEVIADRQTGFLARVDDLSAWTEAILRLVHDPDLRAQMGRRAREAVENQFPLGAHYARVLEAYRDAIQWS